MHVERLERWFMLGSIGLLVAASAALVLSLLGQHATLPTPAGRLDPTLVRQTAPFDAPGLRQTGPDTYDAVVIAQTWAWEPDVLEVPAGSTVRFITTSLDVVHGFKLAGTNANAMVIPGQVTEVDVAFDEPGEHTLICHEYCGLGHHQMGMTVRVTG